MSIEILTANLTEQWRESLSVFSIIDVCHLPEYHQTYASRSKNAQAMLWSFKDGENQLSYPFLLTLIEVESFSSSKKAMYDITSIYGYSGPLSTTTNKVFLTTAWKHFDLWALAQGVIAEFIRFSPISKNLDCAHPKVFIEKNRQLAFTNLETIETDFFSSLNSKTKNMIRKAEKSGLRAELLDLKKWIPKFISLYNETMDRNDSGSFFNYDEAYFNLLLKIPHNEIHLYGIFFKEELISSAISLSFHKGALYHLGASNSHYSNLGASNLLLYFMSTSLQKSGVQFLNLGGGRTPSNEDPLFRFKKNNGNSLADYFIGKRILNDSDYDSLKNFWAEKNKVNEDLNRIIFYRN